MKRTTLTKSRFKLALECPTKVFYSLDKRYVNAKQDDDFMQALADGGFPVGALAKAMYQAEDPDAVEVKADKEEVQIEETEKLLARENVTIFEGTIRHGNLVARVDVLRKRGNVVELIEVKAKSWDPREDSLTGKTARSNPLDPEWEPYVYDLAFQERLLRVAYPQLTVHPWLLLVDKSRANSVQGLAFKFPIVGVERERRADPVDGFDVEQLQEPLLIKVDAREVVRVAQAQVRSKKGRPDIVFDSLVDTVAGAIARDERLGPYVGPPCKSCEFYCPPQERSAERRSGWAECMETRFKRPVTEPREVSVFGFHDRADSGVHLARGRLLMRELAEADVEVKEAADKISRTERHRLQWREIVAGDTEPFVRTRELRAAMAGWSFPLHFIDFETAAPALPFHVGHRPYQPILFQFSHHVVEHDGRVRHATECLIVDGEVSPSIDVARRLKAAVGQDQGTVLHWYPHERNILDRVRDEIGERASEDAEELQAFVESLGLEKDSNLRLFDLGKLVAEQVFLPGTGGSSSMKKFLPAVLRQSDYVRRKYSRPVYGTPEIPSHNFPGKRWVVEHNGAPLDPYQLLNPLFGVHELDEALARLEAREGKVVANGAAAMIAFATLQDSTRPAAEREELREQLLRYCELDTLAMVMVYEALREWVQ
jgi:hypothetical protein